MTRVKICGITSLGDAQVALDAGADALGFNFYERSPRYITPAAAREITQQLPDTIAKIGVFVNESIDEVVDIASASSLTAAQLHGDESTSYVERLRACCDLEIIKAFRVSRSFIPEMTLEYSVEGILLDGFAANARGGTGETFDWEIAKRVSMLVGRLWLAGGLSPENVRAAIVEVKPFAVVACSSLESSPAVKDHARLRNFIKEAKEA
jgi:phosphoribosylanthranilate isomerase